MNNTILAAIDVGTNSFHLIVVEALESGNFQIIDRAREVIRLNEGNTNDIKVIGDAAMSRAIDTLKKFQGIAASHNAHIRAVATSAVRESLNKKDFLRKVFDETGIEIEVVSGIEEARLIYLGVLKAVPVFDKRALIIDIGGGSTELLVGEQGSTIYSNSLKLGAVRLSQKFFPEFELSKSRIEKCRKWVEGEIYTTVQRIEKGNLDVVVGSSGTIQSAGLMILAKRKGQIDFKMLNNFEFTQDELLEIEEEILSRKTPAKRKKISGLEEKRADIIPAGIILLSTIMKQLNIEKITISEYALREGIIIDTIEKKFSAVTTPKLRDIRMNSVKHLAEISDYDYEHSEHVASLALQLFDETQSLHGLGNTEKEYLHYAALLHDIGYHISHEKHHKHSYYIIRNSNMLGFNDSEIAVIANVARYHRKSHPKQRHDEFSTLNSEQQKVVNKLAAILRVADSLDRTHKKLVTQISAHISNEHVKLTLTCPNGEPEIELWNVDRRKQLFENVFGKKILIKIQM